MAEALDPQTSPSASDADSIAEPRTASDDSMATSRELDRMDVIRHFENGLGIEDNHRVT